MMQLHNLQRAVEHEPVNHVRHLAKPAADAGGKLSVLDVEPFLVPPFLRRPSDRSPEGKYFPGPDHNSVDLLAGQFKIGDLVLLQTEIHPLQFSDHDGTVTFDYDGKHLICIRMSILFATEEVLHFPLQNLLLHRYPITRRIDLTEQFPSHNNRLLLPHKPRFDNHFTYSV